MSDWSSDVCSSDLFALEGGWPPLLMAGIRFLVAGSVLFTVLRLRGVPMPTRRQWRNSAFMGALLLVLGNGMVCIAEQSVSSGLVPVAVASVLRWIGLFSTPRGQRSQPLEFLGRGIRLAGLHWLHSGRPSTPSSYGLVDQAFASAAGVYER